jgi:hypothetical protein
LRQRVLATLEVQLVDYEQQRNSPRPRDAASLIAARMLLFAELDANRVLRPPVFLLDDVVLANGRPAHVAFVPGTAQLPPRVAFNTLLADDELARFALVLEADLTPRATAADCERAASRLAELCAPFPPARLLAMLLAVFAWHEPLHERVVSALKLDGSQQQLAPLVTLNVLLGRPLFDGTTVPPTAFLFSMPRLLREGFHESPTAADVRMLTWTAPVGVTWFLCPLCGGLSRERVDLLAHVRSHFDGGECGVCHEKFESLAATLEHCVAVWKARSGPTDAHDAHRYGRMLHTVMPRGCEVLVGCAWQMFRTLMVGPPFGPSTVE